MGTRNLAAKALVWAMVLAGMGAPAHAQAGTVEPAAAEHPPAPVAPVVEEVSAPPSVHAAERTSVTITANPLTPLVGLLFGGFAGELRLEAMIRPHIAIALTGMGMHVPELL